MPVERLGGRKGLKAPNFDRLVLTNSAGSKRFDRTTRTHHKQLRTC